MLLVIGDPMRDITLLEGVKLLASDKAKLR